MYCHLEFYELGALTLFLFYYVSRYVVEDSGISNSYEYDTQLK